MALVRLFRLTPSEIGKPTGYSRSYVSRLLNPRDDFAGSPAFFRMVECKLGTILDNRSSQFFTCPAVSVQRARAVIEQLPEDEVAAEAVVERAA
jgi:hypothetical protein